MDPQKPYIGKEGIIPKGESEVEGETASSPEASLPSEAKSQAPDNSEMVMAEPPITDGAVAEKKTPEPEIQNPKTDNPSDMSLTDVGFNQEVHTSGQAARLTAELNRQQE